LGASSNKAVVTGLVVVIIFVLGVSYFCPISQAQTRQTFTPSDKFIIPELNGSVSFASNGSYSEATLENNAWIFTDLRFNISQPLGNLKISTENSNVNIQSYRAFNFSFRSARLYYTVEGVGKQTVNFDFNSSQPSSVSEWSVNLDGHSYVGVGKGWNLLRDNTVVVTGAAKNATIAHYIFIDTFDDSNLPLYQRHSIAIITIAAVALTVAIAIIIKVKVRKE
jgi:hypothetical protein